MDRPDPRRSEGCREPAGCALGCFALLLLYPAYTLMAGECYGILSPYLQGGGQAAGTGSEEVLFALPWEAIWPALLCVPAALLFCALRLMGIVRRGGPARGLAMTVGIFVLVCPLSYPLVNHSYTHSKSVSCQTSTKQLNLAALMYLQDDTEAPHDGRAKEGGGEGTGVAPEASTAKPPEGEAGGGVR